MALISYLSASLPDRTGGIYGHGNTERVRAGANVGSKCHYVCERHRFDEIRGRAGAQFSFQTICGPLYRRAYQSDRLKRPKRPENHLMWTRRALPVIAIGLVLLPTAGTWFKWRGAGFDGG